MPKLVLVLGVVPLLLNAQTSATVALQSSPNPAVFGAPVTLTTTVTPASATGTVTFYDDVSILGVSQISDGLASFTTRLLNAGAHTVRAYYGGQTASASQTVNSVAAGGFQPAVNYPVENWPGPIAAADFNSDGKIDLVIGNGEGGISILLGNGDGTFQEPVAYITSWEVTSSAVGDFNKDGTLDLAVLADGPGTQAQPGPVGILILLGNGDGSFQAPVLVPFTYPPIALLVIDANNDGNADLVALNQEAATVSVLLGNGDGTFGAPVDYQTAPFQYTALAMAAADFNRDGNTDLAVVVCPEFCAVGTLDILLGGGDGTFHPHSSVAGEFGLPTSVAVGDFNGDGLVDLVVGQSPSGVGVFLGIGDGTFQPLKTSDTTISNIPYFAPPLIVGDFNGDGNLDVAAAGDSTTDGVTVALGKGDGTFQAPLFYLVGSNATFELAAADFNGDGRVDLAASTYEGNTVGILLGHAAATPTVNVISVFPASGSGNSQVFSFRYSDSAGFNDIATVNASLGRSVPAGSGNCVVTYNQLQNTLALWNDDGSLPAGMVPGEGSQGNSSCSLNGSASSVSLSGNLLTLNLAITFTPAGRGQKDTSAEVVSATGATSGWQALGSWTAGLPPQAVSVAPSSGTGMAGTFTFVYADPYGASDLMYVEAVVQTPLAACFIIAYPSSETLLLDGANGALSLGASGSLQNSYCTVNGAGSQGVLSGNIFTLTVSLTFTSALIGSDNVVGLAENGGSVTSGFQTLGSWTVGTCAPNPNGMTVSDVQRIINEALGAVPAVDDMNQDGIVNVVEVQIAVTAALAAACS